ncbi:MAG: DUF1549 domain-containing protein [Verrucomicrobia bacterium]|nr:MAG: DUF1549 domain-containing protein [Verrucomicrobiota bacterium]
MRRLAIALASALTVAFPRGAAAAPSVDFDHDIVPLLRKHCAECHAGDKQKGGLSLNTRETLMKGGEDGPVVKTGDAAHSPLIEAVLAVDPDKRMPPKGPALEPGEVARLRAWIDGGVVWTEGFAFKKPAYEPPLRPRRPVLPAVHRGRTNLVDRILDAQLARSRQARPASIDDATFARRVHLDLVGLLPKPEALAAFLADRRPDKRARLVDGLLANDVGYAEHWLSFWNDLLRNDYAGTGYIDGGRKGIATWLYRSLLENKPYDQFARELVSPGAESEGFSRGIQWRGAVSAGQAVPVQFAQSVGQTFLGINLKCASCHDSFVDRWKLQEAYGLAAIYADKPLELHRCDKPTGKMATPAWLFPEIGQIDPTKPAPERLAALARLLTHPDNGRFTRTIVNRLWHRLMGRGIVHPVDAMQTAPWNADLLDALAVDLADHRYDLKSTLALICKSAAYQSRAEVRRAGQDDHGYHYAGPRSKRLTAEQFIDALWQITGTAPERFDAPVVRSRNDPSLRTSGRWIWAVGANPPPAGDTVTFRRTFELAAAPVAAGAAITADNSYSLFVNGKKAKSDDNWETVEYIDLVPLLRAGTNEIVVLGRNGGDGPNPAGVFFEGHWRFKDGRTGKVATDGDWNFVRAKPDDHGQIKDTAAQWQPVAIVDDGPWRDRIGNDVGAALVQATVVDRPMVRTALLKSDLLQRTLGRPNRELIVSTRPDDLSTLEAMDLSNGPLLAAMLSEGAKKLVARDWKSSEALVDWLYRAAVARPPAKPELALARATVGPKPTVEGVEDLLWSMILLPEFQLVR